MSRHYAVDQVVALAESVLADIDQEKAKISNGQSDLTDFEHQLTVFHDETVAMIDQLRKGTIPPRTDRWYSPTYHVTGEWPLNHPLGVRLLALAEAYRDGLRTYD